MLLETKDLSVAYDGAVVLRQVNVSVEAGKIVGVAGASGCGKTTLLNAMAGILPTAATVSGQLFWQGEALPRELHRQLQGREMAFMPQNPQGSLFPLATIRQQFANMGICQGMSKGELEEAAAEALVKLNLPEPKAILEKYPFELSGGQNQRVCLAMCLLQQARLLLADEPTSGLDVVAQDMVLEEFLRFKEASEETAGAAIVIVSHELGFLQQICDYLYIMDKGVVVEAGLPETVLTDPQHEYTHYLLAKARRFSL